MGSEYPKISIVTPNFNQASYLEQAIRSILDQDYPNLEYIVMDGGSTDGSTGIIKKYESRLSYWTSETDLGMYDAINKGMQRTTGEIMGWLNSDDMLVSGSLYTVAEISKHEEVEWIQGQPAWFDKTGRIYDSRPPRLKTKWDYLKGRYHKVQAPFIQQESTYWRRSLWEKAGSYVSTDYTLAGDFELWMRFFKYTKLYITTSLIGGFRVHSPEQGSIRDYQRYLHEADQIINNYNLSVEEKKILELFSGNSLVDKMPFFRRKKFLERKKYTSDHGKVYWDPVAGKFIVE